MNIVRRAMEIVFPEIYIPLPHQVIRCIHCANKRTVSPRQIGNQSYMLFYCKCKRALRTKTGKVRYVPVVC